MAPETSECAGSWRPVPHLEPGDDVVCVICKRQVYLRPAPLDLSSGPWAGEKHARVEPHSPTPRVGKTVAETPWSEG
jgi:hypothetical protein